MRELRVLLVDDNPEEAERLARVLAHGNHLVIPANGFDEAAEALSVQKFDAVLLGSSTDPQQLVQVAAKLRDVENNKRNAARTPVLSCVRSDQTQLPNDQPIDDFLPEDFEESAFTSAVLRLASRVSEPTVTPRQPLTPDLPVFEVDKFFSQVANDKELLVEIIDLFLSEQEHQVVDMRDAMAAGDFKTLSRVAHTIKGSLSSLHAMVARSHASDLEMSANKGDDQICRFLQTRLEQHQKALNPLLLALREECQVS
jgi:HPt (histidine-containing phosphotransfer) domain-containing protein